MFNLLILDFYRSLNQIATKPIRNFNFMLQISVWITDILLIIFSAMSTPAPSLSNYLITFNLPISLKFVQKHSRPWFPTSVLSYRTWFSAFQKHDWLCLGLSWIDLLNVLFCVLSPLLLQHNKTKRRRLNTAFTGTKHSFEVEKKHGF